MINFPQLREIKNTCTEDYETAKNSAIEKPTEKEYLNALLVKQEKTNAHLKNIGNILLAILICVLVVLSRIW